VGLENKRGENTKPARDRQAPVEAVNDLASPEADTSQAPAKSSANVGISKPGDDDRAQTGAPEPPAPSSGDTDDAAAPRGG
jgi:hypothetical protein